jgi:zinc protease
MRTFKTILFLLFAVTAFSQATLVEKVEKKPGENNIPYEKYKLPNGLTIIINEDHSDPLVAVRVTYHVGSGRESAGKSGFAHFFEHMMFQGSGHIADEQHFHILSEIGAGQENGNTEEDLTHYYETVPSNHLETALWLESDRMGYLLDSLTTKKFENQRDAVKNEKSQNWDNRPYARIGEVTAGALYPAGHPYSWPVIGYVNDLNRAQLEDVRRFFLRWYGPNNACIVLSGDVNTQDALKLIDKYFGNIQRGPEVKKMRVESVVLAEDKYANMVDNVFLPLVMLTYPTVPQYHADEPALDYLSYLLGSGKNSFFYKNFEKQEKAIQSFTGHNCNELAGAFNMGVLPYPDFSGDPNKIYGEVEAKIREVLAEFEKTGFTDADLDRWKATIEAGFASGNESCFGKANDLARFWAITDNKYNEQNNMERYRNVTKEDIWRVYNKYIKGRKCVITLVHPRDASEGNTKIQTAENPITGNTGDDYGNLSYVRPVDNFDRFKRPEVGPYKNAIVPSFKKYKMENGMSAIGTRTTEADVITFNITMKGGAMLDPAKKLGLAALTAAMMDEGTAKYSAEEYEAELLKLGSNISFNASGTGTTISVYSLTKNLDATIAILNEVLFHPRFDEKALRRLKRETKEGFRGEYTDGSLIANKVFNKIVYAGTPLGNYVLGNSTTVNNIEIADIKEYYDKYYNPSHASLVFVGNIDEDALMSKLDFLKSWTAKPYDIPSMPEVKQPEKTTIYFVNMIDATNANITMGYPALPFDYNGEYFKANLMNFSFCGSFEGRLNLDLRENKGYTYGIYGGFGGGKNYGTFTIGASIRGTAVDSALDDIFTVMRKFREGGLTDDELNFTKKSYTSSDGLKYETTGQKASFLYRLQEYGLPTNYSQEQNTLTNSMTKDQINEYAKKYLKPDNMIIVIVADEKISKKALKKKGYTVVELDKNGEKK